MFARNGLLRILALNTVSFRVTVSVNLRLQQDDAIKASVPRDFPEVPSGSIDERFDVANAFLRRQADEATIGSQRPALPSKFKVYVHKLPPTLNANLVQCYKSKTGKHIWQDEGKERSQNTADIWLHNLLLNSDLITENPLKATVFYIPFYGFLSQEFAGINGHQACDGVGHWERVHQLAAWLSADKVFNNWPELQVMTVSFWAVASDSYPQWSDEPFAVVTGPLYKLLSKVHLLLYEPMFGNFRNAKAYQNWTSPTYPIPYVANSVLASFTPPPSYVHKKHKLYFRGNLELDSSHISVSEGEKIRDRVFTAFQKLDGVHFEDSAEKFSPQIYIKGMANSTFCLVPKGDTPTSRRLFDAIMAGCIPIIVSNEIRLPFRDFLDWQSFSVFLDEAKIDADGVFVNSVFKDRLTHQKVVDMRARLNFIRPAFLYGVGDPRWKDMKPGMVLKNTFYQLYVRSKRVHERCENLMSLP